VYDDIYEAREGFDLSNYNKNFITSTGIILHTNDNAKIVGKMKDETAGNPIREIVALKAKMYSYITDESKMVAKGVKKSYIKKHVTHALYKQTLQNKTITRAKFMTIGSKQHSLHTMEIDKVCLSAFDDKRYILPDGIRTLAHGHYSIK